jgi:hypothetical protein
MCRMKLRDQIAFRPICLKWLLNDQIKNIQLRRHAARIALGYEAVWGS